MAIWAAVAGSVVSGMMSSGSGGSSPTQLADPFAASRGKYGDLLNSLMFGTPAQAASAGTPANAGSAGYFDTGNGVWNPGSAATPGTPAHGATPAQSSGDVLSSMPGYQFGLNQGEQAIMAGDSATGKTGGGAEKASLQKFGQDYASTQFSNYANILAQLSGASWGSAAGGAAANAQMGANQIQGQNAGVIGQGVVSGIKSLYGSSGSTGSSAPLYYGGYTDSSGIQQQYGQGYGPQ